MPCLGLTGGVCTGVGGADPPDEPRDDKDQVDVFLGAEQPK